MSVETTDATERTRALLTTAEPRRKTTDRLMTVLIWGAFVVAMIPLTVADVVVNDCGEKFDFGGRLCSVHCSIWNSNLRPRSTAACSLVVFKDRQM